MKIPRASQAALALAALYLSLGAGTARNWLEASMSAHMLVQIPLLVAIGFGAARLLPVRWQTTLLAITGGTLAWVLLALFVASYWMLPRALDAAVSGALAEIGKFVSLPLLVGLPLALSWHRLSALGRGFVVTNFISMLAVLGWLYIVAPVRVCNSYLIESQGDAGWRMVLLAVLLLAGWLATLFVGRGPE